jgi:O-antigen/teichoic acid export membrane protein
MKDSRRFYSSLSLLVVLNLVIKPLWIFAIDRQVQNTVGLQEYGQYFSLFNLSIVLSFLLDWGITTYLNRQLASQQENLVDKAGYFLFIKLAFAISYSLIVVAIAYFSKVTRWDIVLAVILIQALTSFFLFFRSIITAHQWFQTDAWLSVLDKTLMIVLCGSFLFLPYTFGFITLDKFLWSQVACTSLALLISAAILFRKSIRFSLSKPPPGILRRLFVSALPFAIIILLMSIHYRADGFLLERIHPNGSYEAGVYAGAYRLLDAANMVGFLFASFLLPFVARLQNDLAAIQNVILNTRHFLLVFSVGVSCIAIFLAPWIQYLLYHHTDPYSIEVLQFCLPSLIGYSLVSIYGTVMTATGHLRSLCYIVGVSVVVNIILNFVLIPSMGAKGSCIAALVSQTGCGIAAMLYVTYQMRIKVPSYSWGIYLLVALFLAAFFNWGKLLPVNELTLISTASVITLLIMFAAKLIRPADWVTSLRKSHL